MELMIPNGFEEFYLEELEESLCSEHLDNPDKQLVLISAPAEFDVNSLRGEQIIINGCKSLSTTQWQDTEVDLKWELHSTESHNKHLNLLLPSNIHDKHVLAGVLSLTLNVVRDIPIPTLTSPEKVRTSLPKPRDLRARWVPFGSDNPLHRHTVNVERFPVHHRTVNGGRYKPEETNQVSHVPSGTSCIDTQLENTPKKKKKKKDTTLQSVSNLPVVTAECIATRTSAIVKGTPMQVEDNPKKKKKRKKDKIESTIESIIATGFPDDNANGTCIADVKTEPEETPTKKKKKKKKDTSGNNSLLSSINNTIDSIPEVIQNSSITQIKMEVEDIPAQVEGTATTKKRKKKEKLQGTSELVSNTDLSTTVPIGACVATNINGEIEDTPTKKKKKKKRNLENTLDTVTNADISVSITDATSILSNIKTEIEDTPLKKKKRKKKDKSENDIELLVARKNGPEVAFPYSTRIPCNIKIEIEDTPTTKKKIKKAKGEKIQHEEVEVTSSTVSSGVYVGDNVVDNATMEDKKKKKKKKKHVVENGIEADKTIKINELSVTFTDIKVEHTPTKVEKQIETDTVSATDTAVESEGLALKIKKKRKRKVEYSEDLLVKQREEVLVQKVDQNSTSEDTSELKPKKKKKKKKKLVDIEEGSGLPIVMDSCIHSVETPNDKISGKKRKNNDGSHGNSTKKQKLDYAITPGGEICPFTPKIEPVELSEHSRNMDTNSENSLKTIKKKKRRLKKKRTEGE